MLYREVMSTCGNTTENLSSSQMPRGGQATYPEFNTHTTLACTGSQVLKSQFVNQGAGAAVGI